MTSNDNATKRTKKRNQEMAEFSDFGLLKEDAGKSGKPKGNKNTSVVDSLTPSTLKDLEKEEDERKLTEAFRKRTDSLLSLLLTPESGKKDKKNKKEGEKTETEGEKEKSELALEIQDAAEELKIWTWGMGKLTKMTEKLSEEKVEDAGSTSEAGEAYKTQVTWFLEDLGSAINNFIQAFRKLREIEREIKERNIKEELEMIKGYMPETLSCGVMLNQARRAETWLIGEKHRVQQQQRPGTSERQEGKHEVAQKSSSSISLSPMKFPAVARERRDDKLLDDSEDEFETASERALKEGLILIKRKKETTPKEEKKIKGRQDITPEGERSKKKAPRSQGGYNQAEQESKEIREKKFIVILRNRMKAFKMWTQELEELMAVAENLGELERGSPGATPELEEAYKKELSRILEELRPTKDNFVRAYREIRELGERAETDEQLEMLGGIVQKLNYVTPVTNARNLEMGIQGRIEKTREE